MSAPLQRNVDSAIPALGAAVAGDQVVAEAPFAGTVTAAGFTPEAAVTGDNTNTRTLTLTNKGQAGAGAVVVATIAFTTGNNGVAFDEKAFTLSGTPANLVVAEGDILVVVETVGGTGLANPGGRVEVTFARS
ncbi:MAG: hypothetical protein ACREX8_00060 [Gammaproteobacteria bacterium]